MTFEKNIFINCPFDSQYAPILKASVFCIIYLGFKPLLSETTNSAEPRITGILQLVGKAKYSIHDLSRMELTPKNDLARFNMPFELGLDFGCREFGPKKYREKCLLIFDKTKFRYQKAISDLSGNDIVAHNDKPEEAVEEIRNWIWKINKNHIASPQKIWRLYSEFRGYLYLQYATKAELSRDNIEKMPWEEYALIIRDWLDRYRFSD